MKRETVMLVLALQQAFLIWLMSITTATIPAGEYLRWAVMAVALLCLALICLWWRVKGRPS